MIGSKSKGKAREESGATLKPGSKSLANAKGKAKSQTKKVVEAQPKEELRNKAEARDEAVARRQTVTHTEPETVTWKVKKKKDKTNTRVNAQTKTELLAEPGLVPHTKSDASSMSVVITVTKSEVKVDAGIEASVKCSAKARDKGSMKHRSEVKKETCVRSGAGDKASIVINATDESEEYVCSWFWTGEEPSVGSWFWPEEEYPLQVYQPPPKVEEEPEPPEDTFDFTLKKKAAAWARGRFIVLVPVEEGEKTLPPEGNWTLVATLIETPLGIRPLTKIPPFEGPYIQTLAEVKEQIREREKYGPNPKACRCKSRTFSLEPVEFDKLVALLRLTRDPFIHEIATMIMGISPAYPFTQDIVHDVGITVMIENFVNNPNAKRYPKNLNVSVSTDTSGEAKEDEAHVNKVCRDILSCPLNCSVQVEELKLLASLSTKFEFHHVIVNYVRYFISLLNKGSVKIKFQILRVLLCLSKNQANTRELISAEVLSALVSHFHKNESKANILHIIEIFENINFQFKKRAKLFTKDMFTKSELISIFHEAKEFDQKLQDLADHSDPDVRDKVIRLILKL